MFSALVDPDVGQAFVEAGASAFVSKLASVDLLSIIRRVCAETGADARDPRPDKIALSDRGD